MTPSTDGLAIPELEDAFNLDPVTTDLLTVRSDADASEPCTEDGCGQSPTTGHTTGCAAPDGAAPLKGCNAL